MADMKLDTCEGLTKFKQANNTKVLRHMRKIHQLKVYKAQVDGHVMLNVTVSVGVGDGGGCSTLYGNMFTNLGPNTACPNLSYMAKACEILNPGGPQCFVRCPCVSQPCLVNILQTNNGNGNHTLMICEIE